MFKSVKFLKVLHGYLKEKLKFKELSDQLYHNDQYDQIYNIEQIKTLNKKTFKKQKQFILTNGQIQK